MQRLATAPAEVFERAADLYEERYRHARDRTALLCTGLCRRHKPREDFRETPWHGRAAACIRCETFPGPAGRSLWQTTQDARTYWELEQAREKLRMYQRFAQQLKRQRYDDYPVRLVMGMDAPTSGDYFRAREQPYMDVIERSQRRLAAALEEALRKAHTHAEEEA
jgi:hypothetical protein